ncbi:enediyne biosynthesis protein [Verrucosispora sp. ts21]|uniref:RnfABCDGE type electron transport complex subunit D n=1 Tax=Verrucosispora sp. ts21 TaxID=2069341 RepID=UPI000C8884EC|nr:RnfABCDGE type electron transport complex subunit D [Verrucosispora sp. ts21]PMR61712.1 enediyne biosynthesis protein [Verrucosispora sp. ts21]
MADTKTSPVRHDAKTTTALRRFAISITIFNIVGYVYLGFEQPWLWPFIALATGYTVEIVLEVIGARAEGRAPRFLGGGRRGFVEFLFPAHITSLAVNMLTYVNDRVWVMMFGVTVAIAAKWILRAPVRGRLRHYMNPSNFGIAMILILFPWASIAPPYHFTEHTPALGDWLVPAIILTAGTMLNAKLTGRTWLIMGWLSAFVLQAVIRGVVLDVSILGALGMMTSVAFVLFTNYMITDPGTSPSRPASQIAFGAGVASLYGLITGMGIAYGLFFATAAVCLIRGMFLWALHISNKAREEREAAAAAAAPTDGVPVPATATTDAHAAGPNSHKEAVPA